MTPEKLAELKALADAATPPPWEAVPKDRSAGAECRECGAVVECSSVVGPREEWGGALHICDMTWADRGEADAAFFAAARESMPALLAERDELAADRDKLLAACRRVVKKVDADASGLTDGPFWQEDVDAIKAALLPRPGAGGET